MRPTFGCVWAFTQWVDWKREDHPWHVGGTVFWTSVLGQVETELGESQLGSCILFPIPVLLGCENSQPPATLPMPSPRWTIASETVGLNKPLLPLVASCQVDIAMKNKLTNTAALLMFSPGSLGVSSRCGPGISVEYPCSSSPVRQLESEDQIWAPKFRTASSSQYCEHRRTDDYGEMGATHLLHRGPFRGIPVLHWLAASGIPPVRVMRKMSLDNDIISLWRKNKRFLLGNYLNFLRGSGAFCWWR